MKPNPPLTTYSDQQAAQITGLLESTLANLRKQGTGPAFVRSPFNGEARYTPDALNKWLSVKEVKNV